MITVVTLQESLILSYPLPWGWTLHADHLQVSWSLWLGFSPLMDLNLTQHTFMKYLSYILINTVCKCTNTIELLRISSHMTPLKIPSFFFIRTPLSNSCITHKNYEYTSCNIGVHKWYMILPYTMQFMYMLNNDRFNNKPVPFQSYISFIFY